MVEIKLVGNFVKVARSRRRFTGEADQLHQAVDHLRVPGCVVEDRPAAVRGYVSRYTGRYQRLK